MPRSIPGYYAEIAFDRYVSTVKAVAEDGMEYTMVKDDFSPRWKLPKKLVIRGLSYEVDLKKMEREELFATDYSLTRPGFAGILNYSVFGWINGTEHQPVSCSVETFAGWPVYSTIAPKEKPANGSYQFSCPDYFHLADGQTYLGPSFQVKKFEAPVPLFVVSYSEKAKEYIDEIGLRGILSMTILKDYFGSVPFQHYTISKISSVFPDSLHKGGFAMEHFNSLTIGGNERSAIVAPGDSTTRLQNSFGVLHHMAHAYLPLRSYGDRYLPQVQEIPPIIKNIWFNEGFIWFLCYDTIKSQSIWNRIYNNSYNADDVIRRMPLIYLSETGSTLYVKDLRIGMALYSRGAMMAYELDKMIKEKTGGKKSMKQVFRYLFEWSQKNKRAFTMEEFPGLVQKASGVDVLAVYQKWLQPVK